VDTFELDEEELQNALTHLYDPDYRPPAALCAMIGCEPQHGSVAVQSAIIQAIRELEPVPEIPRSAYAGRAYDVIYHRYVLRLTQEETAELLNLSVRHLNRVQREGVHLLARVLWERGRAREQSTRPAGETYSVSDSQAPDWQAQVQRELASLQASTPGATADVTEVIDDVLKIENALTSRRGAGVNVDVGFVQPGLIAVIHPTALSQILITAMRRLIQHTATDQVTIYAGLEDGGVKITMTTAIRADAPPAENDLIRDVLLPEGASVKAHVDGAHTFLWVWAPSAEAKSVVMVVDDNVDMAHFYRRATAGTRYHIVHTTRGEGLLQTIEAVMPDAVVLDVMLPDTDGWKLLMQLHEDPRTRSTPVIVCTVVREEELALSLGAAMYLPKPVRPRDFIRALDQVLAQA